MNNSKILLSSIVISILCSVSLEANCVGISGGGQDAKFNRDTQTCILSNVTKYNYDIYYESNNQDITGKKIIIQNFNSINKRTNNGLKFFKSGIL